MHFRCFADDQNKKLILGRNILTEIFLAQLLEGAVSAQLVDGAVEGATPVMLSIVVGII